MKVAAYSCGYTVSSDRIHAHAQDYTYSFAYDCIHALVYGSLFFMYPSATTPMDALVYEKVSYEITRDASLT